MLEDKKYPELHAEHIVADVPRINKKLFNLHNKLLQAEHPL